MALLQGRITQLEEAVRAGEIERQNLKEKVARLLPLEEKFNELEARFLKRLSVVEKAHRI